MNYALKIIEGIIEYTDTLIRVQTRAGLIRIQGKRLRIQYYTNDEIMWSIIILNLRRIR